MLTLEVSLGPPNPEADGLAERLQRLRQNPFAAYGIALAAVGVATIIRWAIGDYVPGRVPFTLYFPAIVIASLLGGFWPGVLATILSGLAAWFLFIPVRFDSAFISREGPALLAFGLVALLLVGLVSALNSALDRLLIEIKQRRDHELALLRFAEIVESSHDAIVTKDLNAIITSWNKGAERVYGYTSDEVIGKPVTILMPPERYDEEPAILERIRRGERIEHYESVRRRKDGSLIDISLTVSPLKDAAGNVIGASKIARDVSERKRAAEQQDMLTREMSHRVKNAFAVVNGIVALSARSGTPQEMAREIGARLAALARAHDLARPGLIKTDSRDIEPMTFHALVHAILAPYVDSDGSTEGKRIIVNGPDIPLAEKSTTSLALVLHELATNAVKSGTLSTAKGLVRIESSVEDGQFLMTWEEQNGPRLNGPPDHEGFGSLLARRIVTGQFAGQLSHDWKPTGLIVRLSAPMERFAT
jgi:PAS domain S-box-containing protein